MNRPPIFEPPHNFLALPEKYSSWDKSRAVMIPAPYDGTTSYKAGTREGPFAIISASQAIELYLEEFGCEKALDFGIHTLPPVEPTTVSPEAMVQRVQQATEYVLGSGKFPVLLGGEHSLTTGASRAVHEHHEQLGFIVIDAHGDMRDEYHGSPYNHACVSRRLWEMGPVLQIGRRSICVEETELFNKNLDNYHCLPKRDVAMQWDVLDTALKSLPEKVYVSIDLDGFDPSVMPAVGTPEPGGLLWEEGLDVVRRICDAKQVVGFDVVELCPIPGMVAPDFFAAKLVYLFLSYVFAEAK